MQNLLNKAGGGNAAAATTAAARRSGVTAAPERADVRAILLGEKPGRFYAAFVAVYDTLCVLWVNRESLRDLWYYALANQIQKATMTVNPAPRSRRCPGCFATIVRGCDWHKSVQQDTAADTLRYSKSMFFQYLLSPSISFR